MTRRCSLPLVVLLAFVELIAFARPAGAAGSVSVAAWTCAADLDAASTDPAAFAAACPTEATGLTFALTAGGITRRRVTAPAEPARWPVVSGPFTLTLEDPPGEVAVVFCSRGDAPAERIEAPIGQIEGELPDDASWDCQWYRLPTGAASPVAQASPLAGTPTTIAASATPTVTPTATATTPPTATATPTTAPTSTPTATPTMTVMPTASPTASPTATATPTTAPTATSAPTATPTVPPTATPTSTPSLTPTFSPTATVAPTLTPTATATPTETPRPDPRATATAVASAIATADPDYFLPIHALSYSRGAAFKVYPDPGEEEDVGFAVEDFVVDVTFVNPDPGPDGVWDYGILFGPTADGSYYRIAVLSDGRWLVDLDGETLREDEALRLDVEERGSNSLRLIVTGGRGILFINDRLAGSFEVQARTTDGQLWLASTNVDGADVTFLDLSIWSIPAD